MIPIIPIIVPLYSHYMFISMVCFMGIPLYYYCIKTSILPSSFPYLPSSFPYLYIWNTTVLPLYYHSQYIWNKIYGRPPRQHWAATASGNGKRNSEVSLRHGRVVFRWFFGGHGGHGVAPNHPQNLQSVYPLVICYIAMERSTIFNGKIHYKWPFSIAFC